MSRKKDKTVIELYIIDRLAKLPFLVFLFNFSRSLFETRQHLRADVVFIEDSKDVTKKLVDEVNNILNGPLNYFFQLFLSSVIATLGLQTDNTAVVIGAMLVSPLFWPIAGMNLGFFTIQKDLLRRSFNYLWVSFFLVIGTGMFLHLISPLKNITVEIASRGNPTIIDLLIAVSSGFIGIFALYNKKMLTIGAGAAVSVALLPPLCVIGIAIGMGHIALMIGSLLFFFTNVNAILFASVVFLQFLKYKPQKNYDPRLGGRALIFSLISLLILSIPLVQYLRIALVQSRVTHDVETILKSEVNKISVNSAIEDVEVTTYNILNADSVNIEATVLFPENTEINLTQKNQIAEKLSDKINKAIELNLRVVYTVNLAKEVEQEEVPDEEQQVDEKFLENSINLQVQDYLLEQDPNTSIEQIVTRIFKEEQPTELLEDAKNEPDPDQVSPKEENEIENNKDTNKQNTKNTEEQTNDINDNKDESNEKTNQTNDTTQNDEENLQEIITVEVILREPISSKINSKTSQQIKEQIRDLTKDYARVDIVIKSIPVNVISR